MNSSQQAILRCATRINSFVPSRIVQTDLTNFGRSGKVQITFNYEGNHYKFIVPFTRPYLNKANEIFANLINLNQHGKSKNEAFQDFIIKITNHFTVSPAIEIPCEIVLI